MANFCCPIECEPRTLKEVQISHAREIAVDIVQKMEPDEASTIFNEGLKPVVGIKETAAVVVVSDAIPPQKAEEEQSNEIVKGQIYVETCCQCSSSRIAIESSTHECRIKEPLSAPF
ncbi:hypothetical protein ACS0TY_012578 [Phlomoides rotata]